MKIEHINIVYLGSQKEKEQLHSLYMANQQIMMDAFALYFTTLKTDLGGLDLKFPEIKLHVLFDRNNSRIYLAATDSAMAATSKLFKKKTTFSVMDANKDWQEMK